MKMAIPRGMFQRGTGWYARKDVPVELRAKIGLTSMQRALGSDFKLAVVQFHHVMGEFERRIIEARSPTPLVWGQPIELPGAGFAVATKPSVAMTDVFEQWKIDRKPAPNTVAEYERAMQEFIALCGRHPIAAYGVADARKWKQYVASRDRAHATLAKQFGALVTLFRWAGRQDYLTRDPFEQIVLERPKSTRSIKRPDWELDDLRKWFQSPVYTERYRPRSGEAAYWVPVLALFHGCRAGELCQLDKADLVHRNGIACLRISPSDEDDEGPGKRTKTEESVRIVPLHRRVIALGFLDYVKTVRGTKMFPRIQPDTRGRWSGHFSKWFGNYRRSIGLDERWKDFHALRHSWKSAAKAVDIPEEIHDAISGHDNASVGRSYGSVPVPRLKRELDKIKFDVSIPIWKKP